MVARRAQASSLIYCVGPPTTRIRMAQDSIAVLLVEDDLTRPLRHSDHRRGWASSISLVHVPALAAALDALHRARFDAVPLDLGLPDSEGLATLDCEPHRQSPVALPIARWTARSDQQAARPSSGRAGLWSCETEPNQLWPIACRDTPIGRGRLPPPSVGCGC
jgi:CheY-like chemotaxis protein